jgi:hypothetical protein
MCIICSNDAVAPGNLVCNDWESVDYSDVVTTSILEGETFSHEYKRVYGILINPFVIE